VDIIINKDNINYKEAFYKLMRDMKKIEVNCLNERCPLGRQCCHMCSVTRDKLSKIKDGIMKDGLWEEEQTNGYNRSA
jgi:hypothetical protein